MAFFVNIFSESYICLSHDASLETVGDLKMKMCRQYNLSPSEFRITHNGRHAMDESIIERDATYHLTLPLIGGKGGFGSMLRMLGAQIEKTTNHEACRDLSGRRMRDVNNEKKLADWLHKKAEMEREREEKRKAKLERMRSKPRHVFVDPNYDKQKKDVLENLDDAITQGLQASTGESLSSASTSTQSIKRKIVEDEESNNKKSCLWMGVDMDSDSENEEDADNIREGNTTDEDADKRTEENLREGNTTDQISQPEDKKPAETSTSENSLLQSLPPPTNENADKANNSSATEDNNSENEPVDLDQFSSACELETVGLVRLKLALTERGLKCGGTLQERASRLYSVKGLAHDEIDPSLLTKSKGKKGKKSKAKN